jgi:CDGSH-type Zn-finger protein
MGKEKNESKMLHAQSSLRVVVTEQGPYLLFGRPPMAQQFIMPDDEGYSWYFQEGQHFSTEAQPTALCRCGASHKKPYCDGSHTSAEWSPQLTAPATPLLDDAESIESPTLRVTDNPAYCVFARFCEAQGGVWQQLEHADTKSSRQAVIRATSLCPSGRLTAWQLPQELPYEYTFEPSVGLIEDPTIHSGGGIWLRGGIPLLTESGASYEVRNRMVLCRCGQSRNKPHCDGAHAAIRFHDDLSGTPDGETLPESLYD